MPFFLTLCLLFLLAFSLLLPSSLHSLRFIFSSCKSQQFRCNTPFDNIFVWQASACFWSMQGLCPCQKSQTDPSIQMSFDWSIISLCVNRELTQGLAARLGSCPQQTCAVGSCDALGALNMIGVSDIEKCWLTVSSHMDFWKQLLELYLHSDYFGGLPGLATIC